MDSRKIATLIRLDDTCLTLPDPDEDVRGRKVLDPEGQEVGDVRSLLIDDREHKVRFLEVASRAVLGLGGERRLVPADAVIGVEEDAVGVDESRRRVHRSPEYDPELEHDEDFYRGVYGYYGYAPVWMAGYAYPGYPYY